MASTKSWSGHVKASLLPLLVLLTVFGVYAATAEKSGINTDAYAASAGAWRIATAGTPWFDGLDVTRIEGTHASVDGTNKNGTWLEPSPNGHVATQRMPGPILAGIPFYWVLADGPAEADFSLLPGGLAASFLSAAAVMLLFMALRGRVSTPLALTGALMFAFATPTWSVSANGLWTHPVTQLGIAGAAFSASRNRWWLAGVFLGVGMLGRPHLALVAAVLGVGVAWSRRSLRPAVGLAVPTLGALGLVGAWHRVVHGEWSIRGGYDYIDVEGALGGLGASQLENYLGFLFSADRGFLVWTPVVLLFVPAVVRARRDLPDWSLWLAAGGVLYTFFQLRLNYFAGGEGFYAYRHGLELLTCLVPMLVFAAPHLGPVARRAVPVVLAIQIAALTLGAVAEAYFVPLTDVWSDNGFWLALRHNQGVVGSWLALAVATGLLVTFRYVPVRPTGRAEPAHPEQADDELTGRPGSRADRAT